MMRSPPRTLRGPAKDSVMGIDWNISVLIPILGLMWGGSPEPSESPPLDAKASARPVNLAPFFAFFLNIWSGLPAPPGCPCGALFIIWWLLLLLISVVDANVKAMAARSARLMNVLIWKLQQVLCIYRAWLNAIPRWKYIEGKLNKKDELEQEQNAQFLGKAINLELCVLLTMYML